MHFTPDLYNEILLDPLSRNADELRIVSGYATSAMAERHLMGNERLKLSLLVGMCPRDGISITNHLGFVSLARSHAGGFQCHYRLELPTHSKLYIWYSRGKPMEAYVGSANYTQQAFLLNSQNEILSECNPTDAHEYFLRQMERAASCLEPDIENEIPIVKVTRHVTTPRGRSVFSPRQSAVTNQENVLVTSVELPLYSTRTGHVEKISGLNWGQRADRNRDQAYLPVPAPVQRCHFFPSIAVRFHVATDDGEMLEMSVAQANGKGIHTPEPNAALGAYFRRRLGVPSGQLVTDADLDRYGRRTVTFTKFDDETYFMDFSVR